MGMTPDEFFDSFVEGNRWDCHDLPGDIRRAFNAAVAASHFADHYFNFNKRHNPSLVSAFDSIGPFVEHLITQTNGAFRDIRSISNAYKHLYTNIDSKMAAYSSVNSSGSIDCLDLPSDEDLAGLEEDYSEAAEQGEARVRVVFTRKDGTRLEFLPTLDKVVDYLCAMTYQSA